MASRVHHSHRNHQIIHSRPDVRDTSAIANPVRSRGLHVRRTFEPSLSPVLDRRSFNFGLDYPTLNVWGSRNRFVIPTSSNYSTRATGRERFHSRNPFRTLSPRVVISRPDTVLVCIRRNRRREVIHARGIAGSRVRKPRANSLTKYHCR